MGEQGHPIVYAGHLWSPIMRNSRGKFFVYLAVIGTMCFIVFLLSNTHSNLKQLEGVHEKCQQQRDSLSAQLQVVYEHKNRLEKSLQQEKTEHKHTKEEYEDIQSKHNQELKIHTDKEATLKKQISELKSSNSELESNRKQAEETLKDQIESLQTQKDEELKKLQGQVSELLAEKDKIEQARSSLAWKAEQHTSELNLCQIQKQQMEENLSNCEGELKKVHAFKTNASPGPLALQFPIDKLTDQTQNKMSSPLISPSPKDKTNMLERPHVQQSSDNKNTDIKNELKETNDIKNELKESNDINVHMLPPSKEKNEDDGTKNNSHINAKHDQLPLPMLLQRNSAVFDDHKDEDVYPVNKINFYGISKQPEQPEADNLPQVPQPPEGINQPAEKGEYVNGILPGQLEQPDFKENNHIDEHGAVNSMKKNMFLQPNNINEQGANDAAQVQDMLDKSPGDTNDIHDNRILMPHAQNFQAALDKLNLNREPHLAKGRPELPDEKQYGDEEEGDQDDDNEEEMGAGAGQPVRGKVFHERDFDDQEPNDNNDKVEGVAIIPK